MRSAIAIVVFLLAAPVLAEDRPEDPRERARDHFERGLRDHEQQKYASAASELRAAYALRPAAPLLFNEAVCVEKLGDDARAAALFTRYLAEAPDAHDRPAVEARIATLLARRPSRPAAPAPPHTAPKKLRGVLFIESKPPGATIHLGDKDGAPLGRTPWAGTLDGTHDVILRSPGFADKKARIRTAPGTYNEHFVAFSGPFLGGLEVRSNVDGARVHLDTKDGRGVGSTPFMGHAGPGKHTVFVSRPGFKEARREIVIVPGQPHVVHVQLEPER